MNVKRLLKDLGGAAKVARQLKSPKRGRRSLTTAAVCMWKRVPIEHVHEIARLSGGLYTPETLRPDVFKRAA